MARTRKRKPFEYHRSESDRAALAEIPDSMKCTAGHHIGNITADDIVWRTPGKNGGLGIHLPEQAFREATLIVGRRGGKNGAAAIRLSTH